MRKYLLRLSDATALRIALLGQLYCTEKCSTVAADAATWLAWSTRAKMPVLPAVKTIDGATVVELT